MKRILSASILLLFFFQEVSAQTGAVIYSLPRTTVTIKVKAEHETITPGPYAAYAQKYFGVAANSEPTVNIRFTEITLVPFVEADPEARYVANIPDKSSANFLQFCAQGLVAMSDNYNGNPTSWRFTGPAPETGAQMTDPLGNLGTETTVLYKAVRKDDGYERVPVNQDNVVEKSADRKAADAAAAIFTLREKRSQIATGDTDATFSGEALQAAIDEITRLEERYLSLFYGTREISVEEASFDVTPQAGNGSQRITAFRIADRLLPASAKTGSPVTLELKKEPSKAPEATADSKGREGSVIRYRIPAITVCRLMYGDEFLLESRIPVYQLGEELTFPVNVLITR